MNPHASSPPPAARGINPAEWDARVKLAACYRMVAKLGIDRKSVV